MEDIQTWQETLGISKEAKPLTNSEKAMCKEIEALKSFIQTRTIKSEKENISIKFPLKPKAYSHIYPEEDNRHDICYTPAGPGNHQPVFTQDQLYEFAVNTVEINQN